MDHKIELTTLECMTLVQYIQRYLDVKIGKNLECDILESARDKITETLKSDFDKQE